jgi:hypothetical protein
MLSREAVNSPAWTQLHGYVSYVVLLFALDGFSTVSLSSLGAILHWKIMYSQRFGTLRAFVQSRPDLYCVRTESSSHVRLSLRLFEAEVQQKQPQEWSGAPPGLWRPTLSLSF